MNVKREQERTRENKREQERTRENKREIIIFYILLFSLTFSHILSCPKYTKLNNYSYIRVHIFLYEYMKILHCLIIIYFYKNIIPQRGHGGVTGVYPRYEVLLNGV